ncbi:MAG: phosphoribosyltransferase [Bacteroidia bacterium]|nr:phosphoribosyltransferase [Bacteroidia bacterium]MCZ2277918.1 phosphoribosyltransferase [Bacteroidia bacterium]
MTEQNRILLLNKEQIEQRINRIAFQIYEDCYNEKEVLIAGIRKNGFTLAAKIEKVLNKICKLKTRLIEVRIDKSHPLEKPIELSVDSKEMSGKTVILVDDVLNSGKTLTYSLRKMLNADLKKLRTVLLVDRDHKLYPVSADFVGMTLSTTMQEHVTCEFRDKDEYVYLS